MNEHDKKEVMNLIKIKKIVNGGKKMKGYRINPNKEHVDMIVEGLINKGGYCPCKVLKDEINICPCVEFIELGKCCCKLWVKKED